jgi:hypothetical protein
MVSLVILVCAKLHNYCLDGGDVALSPNIPNVIPDPNYLQDDDFAQVFDDDEDPDCFEYAERPQPHELLDRYNGMSYHFQQENETRNSIVHYLASEGVTRPLFASDRSRTSRDVGEYYKSKLLNSVTYLITI